MRAQTTLDFAIGVSIFLSVMLFVFAFVPGILVPFDSQNEDHTVLVNRIADGMVQGDLGSPENPYVLDRQCTVDFFAGHSPGTNNCNFNSGSDIAEQLRLDPTQKANVSIISNLSVADRGVLDPLCWDSSDEELIENDEIGSCPGTVLTKGADPPDATDSTIVARRVVGLAGETATIKVVVW